MKKIIVLLSLFSAVGCSPMIKIDDRMSFESIKYYRENLSPQPKIDLVISDDLKKMVISKRASGFVGGGVESIFNMGQAFSLYIEQAAYETFNQKCPAQCANIFIKSNSFNFEFTYSASAFWVPKAIIDWVKINAEIEVVYNKNLKKIYLLKTVIDIPASQIMGVYQQDKAVTMALEDITKQLITAIVKNMNDLKQ